MVQTRGQQKKAAKAELAHNWLLTNLSVLFFLVTFPVLYVTLGAR